jgi:superfamily II DNA or RNA helicase
MPPEARPYQIDVLTEAAAALETHRSVVLVVPTGGGKTVIMGVASLCQYEQGASLWVTAHREELVDQISATFHDFDIPHGIVKSGMPLINHPIQVGMIQTLKNKLQRMKPPDFLYIDECHHTPASQYDYIIQAMPAATKIIGVTATPCRLDGKGLDKYYSKLVLGPSISELIGMGYLVPPIVYAPQLVDTSGLAVKFGDYERAASAVLMDDPRITGDCIEHYNKLARNTSAVAFCVNVEHAKNVAKAFNEAGIPAASIDGAMRKHERKQVLDDFRAKRIMVLTSADLISEGFDCPGIETAILLRPTKSESLFLQQIGRALRLAPGKTHAIILDHVANCLYHGFPTDEREWSLEGAKKRKKKDEDDEFEVHTCRTCYRIYRGKKCPECLVETLRGEKREIKVVEGNLQQIEGVRTWLKREEMERFWQSTNKADCTAYAMEIGVDMALVKKVLTKAARSYEELLHVGKILDYSPGWAKHKAEARHYIAPEEQMRLSL